MALGGIPVSGGAAGHGTLIYCNLLYSPLLYDAYGNPQARPAYTLGGTAGAAGYEAVFAIDKDPQTLYKTAASAGAITLTMVLASAYQVYGVVLLGHNLTVAGITSAKFEGGAGNYTDFSENLAINAATLTPAYFLLSTAQIAAAAAYTQWRINVTFAASTALQIGEVFLIGAAPYAFAKNYNKGFVSDMEYGKVSSSGISGIPRVITRWERKRYNITFTEITEAQLTALQDAARNEHVIFSPTGASGKAYFGVIEVEPPTYITEVDGGSIYNVTVNFTEAAR